MLVAGVIFAFWRFEETISGDVFVVEERRQLGRDDFVADAKGSADACAYQSVEGICAPPQPSSQVTNPKSSPTILSTAFSELCSLGGIRICSWMGWNGFGTSSIFVMKAEVHG
jgi:hypothetical protein